MSPPVLAAPILATSAAKIELSSPVSSDRSRLSPHLQRLEDEAIHILREVVAEFRKPVMLYSVGKDSSVMLHLARKAFFPAPPPFPFLHIATGWDFRDLIEHRDRMAADYGLDLLVHGNEEATRAGVNPFDTETGEYSRLMLTEALKAALDRHGFDAAFGGGRRDEEKARAKERIFSHRSAGHVWDPRNQRPELWRLFNTRLALGRHDARLPAVELDRARRLDLHPGRGDPDRAALSRRRAPGRGARRCADRRRRRAHALPGRREGGDAPRALPHPGLLAADRRHRIPARPMSRGVIAELLDARSSERQGRLVDGALQASMERKKREGYF